MHTAGSGICCNMFTEHNERIAIVEWMFDYYSVSLFSFERLNDFGIFAFQFLCYMIEKLSVDDILIIFVGYSSVLYISVKCDAKVGRNRPWCRCPEDELISIFKEPFSIFSWKSNIYGWRAY